MLHPMLTMRNVFYELVPCSSIGPYLTAAAMASTSSIFWVALIASGNLVSLNLKS